ncbi:MAG: hypothetical protein WB392_04965 [Methanotrichaceae archaeon]
MFGRTIFKRDYHKIRAFETACQRAKDACIIQFISPVSAPAKASEAI